MQTRMPARFQESKCYFISFKMIQYCFTESVQFLFYYCLLGHTVDLLPISLLRLKHCFIRWIFPTRNYYMEKQVQFEPFNSIGRDFSTFIKYKFGANVPSSSSTSKSWLIREFKQASWNSPKKDSNAMLWSTTRRRDKWGRSI